MSPLFWKSFDKELRICLLFCHGRVVVVLDEGQDAALNTTKAWELELL